MIVNATVFAVFSMFLATPAPPPAAPAAPPVVSAIAAVEPAAEWTPEDGDRGRASRLLDELMAPLASRRPDASAEAGLRRLIEHLGDEDWPARDAASRELVRCGVMSVPFLREALDHRDPEVAFRARMALEDIPDDALGRILDGVDTCSCSSAQSRSRRILAELAVIQDAAEAVLAKFEGAEQALAGSAERYASEAEATGDGPAAEGHRLTNRIAEARCVALKFIAAGLKDEVAELRARREERIRREAEVALAAAGPGK